MVAFIKLSVTVTVSLKSCTKSIAKGRVPAQRAHPVLHKGHTLSFPISPAQRKHKAISPHIDMLFSFLP